MSRIDADNVNLGDSFVVHIDADAHSGRFSHASEATKMKALSLLESAQMEAQKIIQEARLRAEQEAMAVAENIKQEAQREGHLSGYEAGYNEGLAALNQEFGQKIVMFSAFVESSYEIKKQILKSAHLDMISLIKEIAQKVCHKKLELDDDVLLNMTKSATDLLKEKETVTIIVNPLMRECVFAIAEELKSLNSLIKDIKIVEDISIPPDGTIVEGLSGRIDARISSQIDEIVEKLLNDVNTCSDEELLNGSDEVAVLPQQEVETQVLEIKEDDSV